MATIVDSNAGQNRDYETFVKLVSSQNGGPLPDLTEFHEYILSQPEGASNLAKLASLEEPAAAATIEGPKATFQAASDSSAGFSNQTSANGSVINLWVYQRVTINVPGLGKQGNFNMGGVTPGFPGGATFGTMFYDNASDFNGDCDVVFTGFGPYYALYFRRNGSTFATYQSGNVGWSTGVAGGSGGWS